MPTTSASHLQTRTSTCRAECGPLVDLHRIQNVDVIAGPDDIVKCPLWLVGNAVGSMKLGLIVVKSPKAMGGYYQNIIKVGGRAYALSAVENLGSYSERDTWKLYTLCSDRSTATRMLRTSPGAAMMIDVLWN